MSYTDVDLARILNQPGYSATGDSAPSRVMEADAKTSTPSPWASEHAFQAAVIAECDQRAILQLEYGLIYAIPNGQYRPGQRQEAGIRAGMPDLCLPVARGGSHALYLELKIGRNKPTTGQIEIMSRMRMEGNLCFVVWDSLSEVMGLIEDYLES